MWGSLVCFEAVSYVSKLAKPVVEVVQSGLWWHKMYSINRMGLLDP